MTSNLTQLLFLADHHDIVYVLSYVRRSESSAMLLVPSLNVSSTKSSRNYASVIYTVSTLSLLHRVTFESYWTRKARLSP